MEDNDIQGSEVDFDNSDDDEVIMDDDDDDSIRLFTEAERSLRLSIARFYESTLGALDGTE